MKLVFCNTLIALFLLSTSVSLAQKPADEFRTYKERYPDDPYVVLKTEKNLDIEINSGKPVISYSNAYKKFYLSENASRFTSESVSHSDFRKLENIEAYTLIPKKRRYKEEDVGNFQVSDLSGGSIFYDDSKKTSFDFPLVGKGYQSFYRANFTITDPHMLPMFYIGSYTPVEKAVFTVRYDKNVEMEFTPINMEGLDVEMTEQDLSTEMVRTWTVKNVPKMEYESGAPGALYFAPQILVRMKSYKNQSEEVRVLGDVNDLHNWYCDFIQESEKDNPELQAISDSIVAGLEDEISKTKALYSWVKSNIKYIAFEDGYNGFIPQSAAEVCHNRYGDCKGMSNLLFQLMRLQGIEAQLAWVGTRELPYKYEENPSPSADNHMIAALKSDGQYYFLDPTHSNLPFGLPSPFIQGKEVMVNKDCESFEVVEVPMIESENNLTKDSVSVKIEGTNLTGTGRLELTGFSRMTFMDRMSTMSKSELRKYCRNYLLKGSNRFILDSMSISNTDNAQMPLYLDYTFHIPDYVIEVDGEAFVNLNLDKLDQPTKFEEERKLPYESRFKSLREEIVVFETDPSHQISEIPDSSSFSHEQFEFTNNYKQHQGVLERRMRYDNRYIKLEGEDFNAWNEYVNKLQTSHSQQIVIRKPSNQIISEEE
ncbi:transglutaminase-like domain-containing protein [Halocola ammonii]